MACIRSHITSVRLASVLLAGMAIAPLSLQSAAFAQTPLTKATITQLRNRVRLKPKNAKLRKARTKDILIPGDQVATGRAAFAEFRFNEGTLARMGERAIFRFIPRSREFVLKKGTVVLLIPPGQGKTRVQTPNVQTGIRGSALFIRHDPASNTTLVGALTDSGIEVSDLKDGPSQILQAGQMLVAVEGDITGLYDFDLQTFFDSSPLTEGILQGEAGSDKVLAEIQAGLKAQGNFATASNSPVIETPSFVKLSEAAEGTVASNSPLGTESGLELSPLESLASQDSNIFPGRSLGISVEADSPDTVIPPSQPSEPEIPEVAQPEPEQADPEVPEPEVPEQDIPEPEVPEQDIPEPETPEQNVPDQEIADPTVPAQDTPDPEPEQTANDEFPGQGNGVEDGFPGRGNGVEDGFPGGNDEANNQTLEATAPLGDVPTTEVRN